VTANAEHGGTGATVVDHLFRTGGGFMGWGGPQPRLFCGFRLDTEQTELCGREQHEHLSPEAFAERERVRDAAPQLLAALEGLIAEIGPDWPDEWHAKAYEEAVYAIAKAEDGDRQSPPRDAGDGEAGL
jgi:hypothetical protein